ncbi:MAG: serine hydrolase [Proteobacteria bacterium]|nr:serine hydrolase [Pseudomonadota bacterium]
MDRRWLAVVLLAACHPNPPSIGAPGGPKLHDADDPDGPHRDAIAAQIKPFLDADIASGLVVGIYDNGRREIYGFGNGPNSKRPDGRTIYELGSVTKVYTSLLFADAIQRREVELDTRLSALLPPGVTAPTKDNVDITLAHLALHSSGLPRLPPTIANAPTSTDPYAKYGEDALYADLVHTPLAVTPGETIAYSNFGAGVLGFVLGKKLAPTGGFGKALTDRVLVPLALTDTHLKIPAADLGRRAVGTEDDLLAVPSWTFDALAGAGALVSTARDQLTLIDAELDAAIGGDGPLRRAMKLSQEPRLENPSSNEGLGWQIDATGRYWHNGGTGGFHAFVGFDPKTRRGVVILASTASSLVDRLADTVYGVLDGTAKPPPKLALAGDLAAYAGTYELEGEKLAIVAAGNRLYIEGRGEPKHRLVPVSDHEFWIEALQAVAIFERDETKLKVARMVFLVGDHQFSANRVPAAE